ncbi:hypothetical protein D6777_02230 [Candidatus Woesearchaeota archaeon]|nr:MAG: hypothetical protein D6777_02230 [Candidatus Woesearchaeota archaeon]
MNEKTIVAIILAVLVLISGVQAYKLTTLKQDLKSGATLVAAKEPATSSSGASGSAPKLPSSLNNLPQMVGGC